MICPDCGSDNSVKTGTQLDSQRHRCKNCGRYFSTPRGLELGDSRTPKLLVLDIETAPMRVFVWGLYKQKINYDNVITDYYILSWAAKWLCESEIMSDVLTPKEAIAGDDLRILNSVWKLIDEADIVIAHNGVRFDIRRLQARFIYHSIPPPMPYQVIDTLKHAQRYFAFSSHKQAYITEFLNLTEKLDTDYSLWKRCVGGDPEALRYMSEYNQQDVGGLEDMYLAIRPYMKSHPNMGIYMDTQANACPNCGHEDLSWQGYYTTPAGRYRAFRCNGCGAIGRSRFNDMSPGKRKNLILPVAR